MNKIDKTKIIKKINKRYTLLGLLGSALLLSSCATTVPTLTLPTQLSSPDQAWKNYQQKLMQLTKWNTSGLVGVIINNNGQSAHFIWKQNKDHFWIQIYGPLGLGAVTFEGDKTGVKLTKNNGQVVRANDLKTLMENQLGWSLPIKSLYYWARGLYNPNLPHTQTFNNLGLIDELNQQGWNIQYSDYKLYNRQYPLAGRIKFRYGNQLKITLINKSWLPNL